MKRIVVALALESEMLHNILRAARKHREVLELDEATQRWLDTVLEGVQLHQLRGLTQY